jgi:hypothetical protein
MVELFLLMIFNLLYPEEFHKQYHSVAKNIPARH